jgi:hypothetical protein
VSGETYPLGLSHSCEGGLHSECLGVERWWDERFCTCKNHAMPSAKCPHTLSRPCECECHGEAA